MAVDHFKARYPSEMVLKTITRNEALIDALIVSNANLTKFGEMGKSLWDYMCDRYTYRTDDFDARFAIFKKIADNIFDKTTLGEKHHFFLQALKSGHTQFVEYLLTNNKVEKLKGNLSVQSSWHFEYWMACPSNDMASYLKGNFDLESKSDKNLTPLLHAITCNNIEHVKMLLKAGASIEGYWKTNSGFISAEILAEKKPAILQIIEEHRKKLESA
jgi:hypothetical protein